MPSIKTCAPTSHGLFLLWQNFLIILKFSYLDSKCRTPKYHTKVPEVDNFISILENAFHNDFLHYLTVQSFSALICSFNDFNEKIRLRCLLGLNIDPSGVCHWEKSFLCNIRSSHN